MPIYEYYCQQCDKEMEVIQKISDAVLEECPKCQGSEIKKLISAAGFRLSGSGWYETDFKSSNKKNLVSSNGDVKAAKDSKTKEASKQSKNADSPKNSATKGKKE